MVVLFKPFVGIFPFKLVQMGSYNMSAGAPKKTLKTKVRDKATTKKGRTRQKKLPLFVRRFPKMPKGNFQSIVPIIGHYVCIELIVIGVAVYFFLLCHGKKCAYIPLLFVIGYDFNVHNILSEPYMYHV